MTHRIQTFNAISAHGLNRLPRATYEIGNDVADPQGILVRSADLHKVDIPGSVLAIARAGAGTNNIPVAAMSARGVVVFNTPGANANAVKELTLAGMLLAARNIVPAVNFSRNLSGSDEEISATVEKGKKQFVGWELPGRTLGVIGLGEIGVQVANAALALGMKVLGYDPQITIRHAWQLSSAVERAASLEEVFKKADVLTVHVPLLEGTKKLVNATRLAMMKSRAVVLNFSRAGIVDEEALLSCLNEGKIRSYVCDFPSNAMLGHPKVVALPHLGASTTEAEDNCAVMAVDELREFLENGNIRNSVNFPEVYMPREEGTTRVAITNVNVPNMVANISAVVGKKGLNIKNLLNKSKGEMAYTLIDVDGAISSALLDDLRTVEGVITARIV